MNNIKVHVPTPEISKLVQEKLFEKGCKWLDYGQSVQYEDSMYLFVSNDYTIGNFLTTTNDYEYFKQYNNNQVHYMQILMGNFTGQLCSYGDGVIFIVDGYSDNIELPPDSYCIDVEGNPLNNKGEV